MAIVYTSVGTYLQTCTSLQDRIAKIEAIIDALLVLSATAVEGEIYEEYELDDGQTKIRTRYRGQSAIMASIREYERVKEMYMNRLQGRSLILIDRKNLPGC